MTEQENSGGIIAMIQRLPQPVRVLIFSVTVVAFLVVSVGGVGLLYAYNANSLARTEPVSLQEDAVSVREFATWDDADAYPAALALRDNGVLYTASYATGTIWRIAPDGSRSTVDGTADQLGSIAGLDMDASGTLYALDRIDPLQSEGAIIWRVDDRSGGSGITEVTRFSAQGDDAIQLPNDIAVDTAGNIYVVDLQGRIIWQVTPDGSRQIWWRAPDPTQNTPAGIAYDATREALLVADATSHTITAIPVSSDTPADDAQELFRYSAESDAPGFNGITTTPDGAIFAAALDTNRVLHILPDTNEFNYLAGGFRGASDVVYDATRQRLYVTNWDQRSLLPGQFLTVEFDLQPRLPFSVDVVDLSEYLTTESTPDNT